MPLTLDDRTELLLAKYGQPMKIGQAAKELGKHPNTIRAMLDDGRLTPTCEGERVCTVSVAAYIAASKKIDAEARQRKRNPNCQWAV